MYYKGTESKESLYKKLKKMLMSDEPSKHIRKMKEDGDLGKYIPEIDRLSNYLQTKEHHPEGDVFEHTMQVLDVASILVRLMVGVGESTEVKNKKRINVLLSALLHDVGKAVTKGENARTGAVTYIGHEEAGVPIAKEFLDRVGVIEGSRGILYGVENHMLMHRAVWEMRESKLVDMIETKITINEGGAGAGYTVREGLRETMGISEYMVLCIADVVGRLSNRKLLDEVVYWVVEVDLAVRVGDWGYVRETIVELGAVIEDKEEANKLVEGVKNVIRNKMLIEEYSKRVAGIKCRRFGELKEKYNGEELEYRVHEDIREQRISEMKTIKKSIKEEWEMHVGY